MKLVIKGRVSLALLFGYFALCPPDLSSADSAFRVAARDVAIKTSGSPFAESWALYSNGTIAEYVRIPARGTYDVRLRAYGDPLGGAWPVMALNVDGLAGQSVTVDSEAPRDYTFTTELLPGIHIIGASFLNDGYKAGEGDRNLYVDVIEIRSPPNMAPAAVAEEQEWSQEARKREDAVLANTYQAIRTHRMGSGTITVKNNDGKPLPGVVVKVELTRHDFLFGANIFQFDKFSNESEKATYRNRFQELFNYATIPFYWRTLDPEYRFTDRLVAWCKARGIRMKGHPILWDTPDGIPPWSVDQPAPQVQARHVAEVIERYRADVEYWEVVNEPAHLPGLRIDGPYRWAREASGSANLIVNDSEVLANGYPPFFNLLKAARDSLTPFDGIGIQAHDPRDMAFPLDRVQTVLNTYAGLGKQLHITEFTPQSSGKKVAGSPWRGVWSETQQAAYAEDFYRVLFAHPAVVAISWWDLSDEGAWLEGGGMLRADLSAKPVYDALMRLIKQEWHTTAEGTTDENGRFQFLGFYGTYRVEIRGSGTTEVREYRLRRMAAPDKPSNLRIAEEQESRHHPAQFGLKSCTRLAAGAGG